MGHRFNVTVCVNCEKVVSIQPGVCVLCGTPLSEKVIVGSFGTPSGPISEDAPADTLAA
jgi:hypothetical protein